MKRELNACHYRHSRRCIIASICSLLLLSATGMPCVSVFSCARAVNAAEISEDISIELPTVSEQTRSALDFTLDPFCLFADYPVIDGDARCMEPGCSFYFQNNEGEYAYSHISDSISISNHGDTPMVVSIEIQMSEVPGISYTGPSEASGFDGAAIGLSVIDENGNIFEMDSSGTISFVRTIERSFSFALAGQCSASEAWIDILEAPSLSVTWQIQPQNYKQVSESINEPVITEVPGITEEPDGANAPVPTEGSDVKDVPVSEEESNVIDIPVSEEESETIDVISLGTAEEPEAAVKIPEEISLGDGQ